MSPKCDMRMLVIVYLTLLYVATSRNLFSL